VIRLILISFLDAATLDATASHAARFLCYDVTMPRSKTKRKSHRRAHGAGETRLNIGKTRFHKRQPEVGSRPGTLSVHPDSVQPQIRVIRYQLGNHSVLDQPVDDVDRLTDLVTDGHVTWIDVQGFGNLETIERIAELFSIHPLALESMVNVPQRPKAEAYHEQLLAVTRMVRFGEQQDIQMEQVALLAEKNLVITFQEKHGDILDPLRRRIHDPHGKIRQRDAGYLMYAIIDTIVDGYYPVIDQLGDHLEELEDRVMLNPTSESLSELNKTKNLLVNLRRAVWPQREAVNSLIRDEFPLIAPEVRIHLRDTYDHCAQSAEVIEMYREMATGLINIYLSSVANRSNDVMKVLTIMASIFIPLTFMAGIYGMNFEHMPELRWKWAYPIFWCSILAVAVGMIALFYRKGWLGSEKNGRQ